MQTVNNSNSTTRMCTDASHGLLNYITNLFLSLWNKTKLFVDNIKNQNKYIGIKKCLRHKFSVFSRYL